MSFDKFAGEICDFLSMETLEAIDYGVLDLHNVKNRELREIFYFFEELLAAELQMNYLDNDTGIFRVSKGENFWYYKQEKHIIKANTLVELKSKVIFENRIWYVFDENLTGRIWG